jgi:hypothetical protein
LGGGLFGLPLLRFKKQTSIIFLAVAGNNFIAF